MVSAEAGTDQRRDPREEGQRDRFLSATGTIRNWGRHFSQREAASQAAFGAKEVPDIGQFSSSNKPRNACR